jgi:hypothetical protein
MTVIPFDTVALTIATQVTTAGTIVAPYPTGRQIADYTFGNTHALSWNGVQLAFPRDFSISLGATAATLTLKANVTIPAGAAVWVTLDRPGSLNENMMRQASELTALVQRGSHVVTPVTAVLVSMGAPTTAVTTAVCALQTPAAVGALLVNGTLAAGGKATLDVPRNVTLTAAGNASGMTVLFTGLDEYGSVMTELLAGPNATTTVGKKAFAFVTSAVMAGSGFVAISAGTGNVLGLPTPLAGAFCIIKEVVDSAVVATGTFVAQDFTTPTNVTGDVRGTYAPATAPNAAHTYHLFMGAVNVDQGGQQSIV